jgi:hypothetical protein
MLLVVAAALCWHASSSSTPRINGGDINMADLFAELGGLDGLDLAGLGLGDLANSSKSGSGGKSRRASRSNRVCPKGQTPVPRLIEDFQEPISVNGCGREGMRMPDDFGLEPCCNAHDLCYQSCGASFRMCEKKFDRCMRAVCSALEGGGQAGSCIETAEMYSGLTKMMGRAVWIESQQNVCTCEKDPESAKQHHEAFLQDFYGRYAPERTEGTSRLLGKHRGREGLLYMRLGERYKDKYVRFDSGTTREIRVRKEL